MNEFDVLVTNADQRQGLVVIRALGSSQGGGKILGIYQKRVVREFPLMGRLASLSLSARSTRTFGNGLSSHTGLINSIELGTD